MTHLRETTSLAYPVSEIDARLEAYFASKRGADGVARVRLRGAGMEQEVVAEVRRTRDDDNLNDILRIQWKPQDPNLLPVFSGTLITWGEQDPQTSYIELEGDYEPPLGVPGQIFDEAIGREIAQATARAFLADIKDDVEAGVQKVR